MIPALLITTLIPPKSSIIESQKLLTFSLWLKSTVKNLILSLEGSSSRKLDIFSSEDPTAAMLENLQKSQDLRQKLIDEDLQKKQDRTMQFDLSDPFMAAGGGIAKEAGDSSGRPPVRGPNSQGLLSLKNRVRNY